MRRPQFALKTLLWLMAVVGAFLATWPAIRPEVRTLRWYAGELVETHIIWRNGTILSIERDLDKWTPKVYVTNRCDVDVFFPSRAKRLGTQE